MSCASCFLFSKAVEKPDEWVIGTWVIFIDLAMAAGLIGL